MPMVTFKVADVLPRPTRAGQKWDVIPALEPGQLSAHSVATFNSFKASLCERAKALNVAVRIGWRETRYDREIVTVELVPNESEAA